MEVIANYQPDPSLFTPSGYNDRQPFPDYGVPQTYQLCPALSILRAVIESLVSARLPGLYGCESGTMDIRTPEANAQIIRDHEQPGNAAVMNWHRDGGETGIHGWLVLWSNIYPTEVRDRLTHERLLAKDGDILLFKNHECEHRIPPMTEAQAWKRWLVRRIYGVANPGYRIPDRYRQEYFVR